MVLLDTSMWIEALRKFGRADMRKRVDDLIASDQAAWCDIILLELWNGARGHHEHKVLNYLESVIHKLPIDDAVWQRSFELGRNAKTDGLTAPAAEVLIAACAKRHGASLEHCDKHLERLVNLP